MQRYHNSTHPVMFSTDIKVKVKKSYFHTLMKQDVGRGVNLTPTSKRYLNLEIKLHWSEMEKETWK